MAASQAFELDPAVIEEIADRLSGAIVARVVEVLREEGLSPRPSEATAWLDAQEVAQRLGVSREWVYEHADELGALRIGSGPRPRLRFPPQILDPREPHHDLCRSRRRTEEPTSEAQWADPDPRLMTERRVVPSIRPRRRA